MSEILFPVIDPPEPLEDSGLYDSRYHPTVLWDNIKGDFVRDGANRLIQCDGMEGFRTWCMKIATTERYSCLAYDASIGTEMEAAMREPTHAAVESALERTITEALMVNPRTEYVRDFEFEAAGDQLWCTFTVKGIDWDEFEVRALIRGGEDDG